MHALDERLELLLGSRPVSYTPRSGGYSTADRFSVQLLDGRSVFVKSAEAENLAGWLRREHEVYAALSGSFLPRLVGWDDDGSRPLLVLEDLSDADWTPSWTSDRVSAVLDAVAAIAASPPPPGTPRVRDAHADLWGRWQVVAADPAPFLSAGLRDARWLERSLPTIVDAVDRALVEGDALCHLDVRSDNLCFRDGRAILVDWNWAITRRIRRSMSQPGCRASPAKEGRRRGRSCRTRASSRRSSQVCGRPLSGCRRRTRRPSVRNVQREQLAVALDWIDRELGL